MITQIYIYVSVVFYLPKNKILEIFHVNNQEGSL